MRFFLERNLWRVTSTFFLLAFFSISLKSQLSTAPVFADNMVLQRNQPIQIWGEASPGEAVHINLHTQTTTAFADAGGQWEAPLDAFPAGGPYLLQIETSSESISYQNVMMGDVWVCAGQSNMARLLKFTDTGYDEAEHANWPNIRLWSVSDTEASQPSDDMPSDNWVTCNPTDILNYSAIAYFFGRDLYQNLDIPIGLMIISKGGTRIDQWISPEGLSVFPDVNDALNELDNLDIDVLETNLQEAQLEWNETLDQTDLGLQQNWQNDYHDWQEWSQALLPKPWQLGIPKHYNGSLWLKKEFQLSSQQANQNINLNLGQFQTANQIYINGQALETNPTNSSYEITNDLTLTGDNVITLRLHNAKQHESNLQLPSPIKLSQSQWQIPLTGYWNYRPGTPDLAASPSELINNITPSALYNGMVHPFTRLRIAGVIWYQGESDTGSPHFYRNKQVKIIDDWRNQWGIYDLPFIVVQLPIFRVEASIPGESSWATIRESQTLTLKRENTALVCTIDSGEALDIHPDNKYLVGTRLARAARKLVYDEQIIATGPSYFMSIPTANSIQIVFRTHGSSLTTTATSLRGFAIAGVDEQFVWANAELINNETVNVWHPDVPAPKYVRYGWSDNPGPLDLFNPEGLPALPFRTDELTTPWE